MAAPTRISCACALLLAGATGCDAVNSIGPEICRRPIDDEPIVYQGGATENGVYMSSEWGEGEPMDLLRFPGGEFYEIHHDLGETPRLVQFWLSFSRDPFGAGEDESRGNSLALAAGNQVEMKSVDDTTLTVVNGSCVDYYLLVVAAVGVAADDPGSGGMGEAGVGGSGTGGAGGG